MKLLIVDDNPINQKFLFYTLKKTFEIEFASNGLEAVNMLNGSCFDVVIMDLMMPVMDGAEATHHIRESTLYNNKRIPIIFLTTLDYENERIRCIESGADDYLIKPIKVENLLNTIDFYIKLKQKYIL